MKVRYNVAVGVVLLILGAVCVFLGLWLTALGEFSPAAIVGFIPLLIGILYLSRPYFWVHDKTVVLPAVLGPLKREFPFQRLEFTGGRMIAVRPDGTTKKLPVTRWMANTDDWAAVMNARTSPAGR